MSPNTSLGLTGDTRIWLFRIFFFAVFAFLILQFLKIITPFLTPLLAAVTVALIFFPVYAWIRRRLAGRESAAAALSVAGLFLVVILPALLVSWTLGREAARMYPWVQDEIQAMRANPSESFESKLPSSLKSAWEKTDKILDDMELDLGDVLLKNLDFIGSELSAYSAKIIKNIAVFFFKVFVMGFALFFFFRDGERIVKAVAALVPMADSHKQLIISRLGQTLSAVARGLFLTAAVQGLLAGVGYAVVGLKFAVVLGFATAMAALIPFVGALLAFLPGVFLLLTSASSWKGLALLAWMALVVFQVDNVLRPLLIGERAKLPILLLFFSMLGGLHAYGFVGILVGPLLIAGVLAFARIYQAQLQAPPEKKPPEAA